MRGRSFVTEPPPTLRNGKGVAPAAVGYTADN